jgi:hypothetical protein
MLLRLFHGKGRNVTSPHFGSLNLSNSGEEAIEPEMGWVSSSKRLRDQNHEKEEEPKERHGENYCPESDRVAALGLMAIIDVYLRMVPLR